MKKTLTLVLCAVLITLLSAGGYAQTLTGTAKGFGGDVNVTVEVEDGKIVSVEATGEMETNGVGSVAIDQLPAKIVEAGSAEVDGIAGATFTSNAIKEAVYTAMNPDAVSAATENQPEETRCIKDAEATIGFGMVSGGRIGPGKDNTDTQVYSFNQTYASVIFDKEGRVLLSYVDDVEVATPNYDGAGMPHFSGFPGQTAYNYDENHDETVDAEILPTEETFLSEIASWTTKRERGDGYRLNSATWAEEMNAYQRVFEGKTVDEIKAWFASYCSDRNGRPLKAGSENEQDAAKYDALSDADKTMLADVTSGATMSLSDAHGDIIAAVEKAYENRQPLSAVRASSMGQAMVSSGRVGPGKDDTDTQVYSINEVYVTALFDTDGRAAYLRVDDMETATPNYDGAGMPHFSGYPGHGGYNYDENHDEKIDSRAEPTDESFLTELSGWITKRDRGESYRMNSGTWASEMDAYEKLFTGMTVDEIKAWFASYCSDRNGRPLKAGSENEQDAQKYDALSDADKAMLADVTSGATISLSDAHGDILAAIEKAYENRFAIDLTVE